MNKPSHRKPAMILRALVEGTAGRCAASRPGRSMPTKSGRFIGKKERQVTKDEKKQGRVTAEPSRRLIADPKVLLSYRVAPNRI